MKKWLVGTIAIVMVFMSSWFLGGKLQHRSHEHITFQPMAAISCSPSDHTCKAKFSNTTLVLEFSVPVVILSPFVAKVMTHANVSDVYLQFRMRDMEMGAQRYQLMSDGHGLWYSEAVLPVCSLGRSDWVASLELKYQDSWWRGEFEFEAVSSGDF